MSVVLPASGWLMMANVRRRCASLQDVVAHERFEVTGAMLPAGGSQAMLRQAARRSALSSPGTGSWQTTLSPGHSLGVSCWYSKTRSPARGWW